MTSLAVLLVAVVLILPQNDALVYSRYEGLLPGFSDQIPTDAQLQAEGLGYEGKHYISYLSSKLC